MRIVKEVVEQHANNLSLYANNLFMMVMQAILALPLAMVIMVAAVILFLPFAIHDLKHLSEVQIWMQFHGHHVPLGRLLYNIAYFLRGFFEISWLLAWFARMAIYFTPIQKLESSVESIKASSSNVLESSHGSSSD